MAAKTILFITRTRLGWSQASMATYLKVSRAQIAMAEGGKRELPMAPYLRLLELVKYLPEKPETVKLATNTTEKAMFAKLVALEIKEKTWQIARAQAKINELKTRLLRVAVSRAIHNYVINASSFRELEKTGQDFWKRQQVRAERQKMAGVYFKWLQAENAHKLLALELQLLETYAASGWGEADWPMAI